MTEKAFKICSGKGLASLLKLSGLLIFSSVLSFNVFSQTVPGEMREITALELTAEMAPGLNLYNTLDCTGDWISGLDMETMWGNPITTFEMIEAMAQRGFKSLRIPVSWGHHMGSGPDFIVDEEWMDRVEEVVNYALDNDMYAIVNIHHDDEWIVPTYEKQAESSDQLEKVWTQIATRLKDYSDYLLFETMNEPREVGSSYEWTGGSDEHRDVINLFNKAVVDAIRGTGGNNESRFIMIPQVGANGTAAKEDMIIPDNDPNIIISIHSYSPYNFALGGNTARWGTAAEIASLQNEIKSYADHFVKKGIPVVLGEWGAGDQDNYGDRVMHYHVYANACQEGGITPISWIYGFNRNTLTWGSPLLEDAILYAFDSTMVYAEDIKLNITSETLFAGDSLQLIATIIPDTATSQEIAWTTHNSKIASINSSGLVIAKGSGNVKVTATAIGKTMECNIFVMDTMTYTNLHIQAEDFYTQSGIQAENCSDENGGQNIGYIQNGDWSSYTIQIDSAGVYNFTARAATETSGGTIEISVNNNVLCSVTVDGSKTGGWQDWYTTESTEIELEKGIVNLKLKYKGSGGYLYNLNWFKLDFLHPTSIINNREDDFDFQSYPNPFTDVLYLNYTLNSQSDIHINVFDTRGRFVQSLAHEVNKLPGNYSTTWNGEGLPNGIYLMRVVINDKTETFKLFLNK